MIKETLTTPIAASCDVLACGGGFAGISAALAAAPSPVRLPVPPLP